MFTKLTKHIHNMGSYISYHDKKYALATLSLMKECKIRRPFMSPKNET